MAVYKTPWCSKCKDAPRAPNHAYCRTCRNEYQNSYRKLRYRTEREYRERAKAKNRMVLYGIDEDRYTELWAQQGGVCAICLLEPEGRNLAVDHDHETGRIRALLCDSCNGTIGMLQEKSHIIRRAAEYVERDN